MEETKVGPNTRLLQRKKEGPMSKREKNFQATRPGKKKPFFRDEGVQSRKERKKDEKLVNATISR